MIKAEAIEQFRRFFQKKDRPPGIENHFSALDFAVIDIQAGRAWMDMPYADHLVGNPVSNAMASGPIVALLDSCCAMAAATCGETVSFSPTLDLRIDHLSAAKPNLTIHAEAEVYRESRFVIFTRGMAYQDNKDQPIARCTINFTPIERQIVNTDPAETAANS